MELLLRIQGNEEFEWIKEVFEAQEIEYDELDLAKQFVMMNEPFAEIVSEDDRRY